MLNIQKLGNHQQRIIPPKQPPEIPTETPKSQEWILQHDA